MTDEMQTAAKLEVEARAINTQAWEATARHGEESVTTVLGATEDGLTATTAFEPRGLQRIISARLAGARSGDDGA